MKTPKTLPEFQRMFPDEEACWEHLRRIRWPRGFRCPRCGHRKSYFLAQRRLEQCQPLRPFSLGIEALPLYVIPTSGLVGTWDAPPPSS